jgi:hypothetical protein
MEVVSSDKFTVAMALLSAASRDGRWRRMMGEGVSIIARACEEHQS